MVIIGLIGDVAQMPFGQGLSSERRFSPKNSNDLTVISRLLLKGNGYFHLKRKKFLYKLYFPG